MKRDGHTHTEYCPHGEVEDTELLIQRACSFGFKRYSITEHAPLPPNLSSQEKGGGKEIWETAAMSFHDLNHYFRRMNYLKKKYASDIQISIGFELDYFSKHQQWAKDFLDEYGPLTDDSILSVHFLPGRDGLRSVDYSLSDYTEGIVSYYGSFQRAQVVYLNSILASIEADLGIYKPKRLGHISLSQKFQLAFQGEYHFSEESQSLVKKILQLTAKKQYALDLNTAGLRKADCQETYPPLWIIRLAQEYRIPLVYGSDSHSLSDIGQGYDTVKDHLPVRSF